MCRFGQFVAAALPTFPGSNEKNLALVEVAPSSSIPPCERGEAGEESDCAANIVLRNRCLQLLHSLLFTPRNTVSLGYVALNQTELFNLIVVKMNLFYFVCMAGYTERVQRENSHPKAFLPYYWIGCKADIFAL
jgi:hypothetical protein